MSGVVVRHMMAIPDNYPLWSICPRTNLDIQVRPQHGL